MSLEMKARSKRYIHLHKICNAGGKKKRLVLIYILAPKSIKGKGKFFCLSYVLKQESRQLGEQVW